MSTMTSKPLPGVGDQAPDVAVQRHDGTSLQLAELWSARPTFLVFTRHFG
jgi:peroxiredoxin